MAFASMSIGVALYPQDAVDRDQLMRLADLALYRAKNEGRQRFAFFESRMKEELRSRMSAEEELKRAIEGDQLTMVYQPIFRGDGETIVAVEAAARWPSPGRRETEPEQFLELAEDRALISSLGEWILRRACTDAQRWPKLKVAVNVSPTQFRSRNFVALVQRVLAETNCDPHQLELELSESLCVESAAGAKEKMATLRQMGVSLALDDYGAGHASLIYLSDFPFEKVKIARTLVDSQTTTGRISHIVAAVVSLGRSLGLKVTAQGVEGNDLQRALQAFRFDYLQGKALCRPLDAHALEAFLNERSANPQSRPENANSSLRGVA